MDVVVFDTETSGMSPRQGHRIIEIGAVRLAGGRVVDEFHSLVDAGVRISPQAEAVHGISARILSGQPRPAEVFSRFHAFLGSALLVAHNASFDLRFLRVEFESLALDLPNRVECTLKLSRQRLARLPNHRLETVYRHLGGVIDASVRQHRALDDARMTAHIWLGLQV